MNGTVELDNVRRLAVGTDEDVTLQFSDGRGHMRIVLTPEQAQDLYLQLGAVMSR